MKSIRISISVWWNSMTTLEKVFFVLRTVLLIAIIAAILIGSFSSWGWYRLVCTFVFATLFSLSAYEEWNERRGRAIFDLCMAAFWLIVSVLLMCPPF